MDALFDLLSLIFNITLYGSGLVLGIHILEYKRNIKIKYELQLLQTKLNLNKKSLKSKTKKKIITYRRKHSTQIMENDLIDTCLKELEMNSYNKNEDFQKYFDLCRKINLFLFGDVQFMSEQLGYTPEMKKKIKDFMGSDYINEIKIIRLIKNIQEWTEKYNIKIRLYNKMSPKIKLLELEPVTFKDLYHVNQIYLLENSGNSESFEQQEDDVSNELDEHKFSKIA